MGSQSLKPSLTLPPDPKSARIVILPDGRDSDDVIALGHTGLILHDEIADYIVKVPHSQDEQSAIDNEIAIYHRLTDRESHPHILRFDGVTEYGPGLRAIRLEWAPNGSLLAYLKGDVSIDDELKLRWATQIAKALVHIHSGGVIHGDLTTFNILLDTSLNAKVADFAYSSLDGAEMKFEIRSSHKFPGLLTSQAADIFAFGSVLYNISTRSMPFEEDERGEAYRATAVASRIHRGDFPTLPATSVLGPVVSKCWQNQYADANAVLQDIQR